MKEIEENLEELIKKKKMFESKVSKISCLIYNQYFILIFIKDSFERNEKSNFTGASKYRKAS